MAEPFKNLLNRDVIVGIAKHFQLYDVDFDAHSFVIDATDELESLALKQRSQQITTSMIKHLPDDFVKTAKILHASLGDELDDNLSAGEINIRGIAGWPITPLADYVAVQGEQHFELSMQLLKEMTKRASSEFAIRLFILKQPEKTLSVLQTWAGDSNQHVRRLVSEGSRPRLPWAMRLPLFIENPSPVIALLEILKDDDSEYVRRSVANNLNDIAKDHPDLVAEIAQRWMVNASKKRVKLLRHACRTLIKNGHSKALAVFGYQQASIENAELMIETEQVNFGEALQFSLTLNSSSTKCQPLLIDYAIHHQKANGKTSAKVFKWCVTKLEINKPLTINKKHPFKQITTRKYYSGLHRVEILVNGCAVAIKDFYLIV